MASSLFLAQPGGSSSKGPDDGSEESKPSSFFPDPTAKPLTGGSTKKPLPWDTSSHTSATKVEHRDEIKRSSTAPTGEVAPRSPTPENQGEYEMREFPPINNRSSHNTNIRQNEDEGVSPDRQTRSKQRETHSAITSNPYSIPTHYFQEGNRDEEDDRAASSGQTTYRIDSNDTGAQSNMTFDQADLKPDKSGKVHRPNSFLVFTIFTTIFCLCPVGLVAMIYSLKTRQHIRLGQMEEARESSKITLYVTFIGIVIGTILLMTLFALGMSGKLGSSNMTGNSNNGEPTTPGPFGRQPTRYQPPTTVTTTSIATVSSPSSVSTTTSNPTTTSATTAVTNDTSSAP